MIPDLEQAALALSRLGSAPDNPSIERARVRPELSQSKLAEIERKRRVREMRRRCGGTFPREREGWTYTKGIPTILPAWLMQRQLERGAQ